MHRPGPHADLGGLPQKHPPAPTVLDKRNLLTGADRVSLDTALAFMSRTTRSTVCAVTSTGIALTLLAGPMYRVGLC